MRDLCVFVKHDLTRDPPFARLDLISCRNVLIYFDAELQRRIVPTLHYALADGGYFFLGRSESITGFKGLFAPLDPQHRIFAKTGEGSRFTATFSTGPGLHPGAPRPPIDPRLPAREAQRQGDHLMLARFAPAGVVVNERLDIVQFRGRTGAFLESPPGQPESNVLRMARSGLAARLSDALDRAKQQSATVREHDLVIETDSGERRIDLEVIPLPGASATRETYFLILFLDSGLKSTDPGEHGVVELRPPRDDKGEVARLKAELVATKDYVQSLIGEHQVTTDELAAANEELIAANEELQSTNEELESAKEELQSANEELNTLNDELRERNLALDRTASDLVNVLASVDIPIIIVDLELRVRRFTPRVRDIANFISEDVGRSIDDLKLRLKVDDLSEKVRGVIGDLSTREWQVEGLEGRWFRMQIRPYRTADNRLDGAVITFVDIDTLKRALKEAEIARDYASGIVETVATALVVLDTDLRVVSANHAFYERFALTSEEVQDHGFFELREGAFRHPTLSKALGAVEAERRPFNGLEITVGLAAGRKILALSSRSIPWSSGTRTWLLAIEDVTELRALESERAQLLDSEKHARLEAERANRAKDLFLATLSHELRTPLSTMLMSAQFLRHATVKNPALERASAAIERSAATQAKLIDDLLDVSRIVSGKLVLDLDAVDLKETVQNSVDVLGPVAHAKGLGLEVALEDVGAVYGDGIRLQQVVSNLLSNAIKFTPNGGRISIRLERTETQAQLTIADTGMGIRAEVLPRLFDKFVQADSSVTRTHGGLGLGLAIVRHLVEVHGGEVRAENPGEGKGATFRVILPLRAGPGPVERRASRAFVQEVRGVRVLLVEDETDAREAIDAMLTHMGAIVRATPSAAAALAELETFQPQVILSDIAMPGEDGYSFIRKVRARPRERGGEVPAVALTALAGDDDRRLASEAGFQIHLAKPIDAARLAAAVARLAVRPASS